MNALRNDQIIFVVWDYKSLYERNLIFTKDELCTRLNIDLSTLNNILDSDSVFYEGPNQTYQMTIIDSLKELAGMLNGKGNSLDVDYTEYPYWEWSNDFEHSGEQAIKLLESQMLTEKDLTIRQSILNQLPEYEQNRIKNIPSELDIALNVGNSLFMIPKGKYQPVWFNPIGLTFIDGKNMPVCQLTKLFKDEKDQINELLEYSDSISTSNQRIFKFSSVQDMKEYDKIANDIFANIMKHGSADERRDFFDMLYRQSNYYVYDGNYNDSILFARTPKLQFSYMTDLFYGFGEHECPLGYSFHDFKNLMDKMNIERETTQLDVEQNLIDLTALYNDLKEQNFLYRNDLIDYINHSDKFCNIPQITKAGRNDFLMQHKDKEYTFYWSDSYKTDMMIEDICMAWVRLSEMKLPKEINNTYELSELLRTSSNNQDFLEDEDELEL